MTNTVLRIDASARTEGSVSRELADKVIERLAPEKLISRDLVDTVPQIDGDWLGANFTPADQRTAAQSAKLALSDALIEEVKAADTLVIALPIYNFGVPSSLKAWVDMIARAGITFNYTENGPVGLLEGKRAIFTIASGGTEVDGPIDFATPWLRHVMSFIGITDVQMVRSDRQMVDAEASKARAEEDLAHLAA
ncbi:FMN-dependent NADH-azoreductase [Mameliella sediminis]|uniref:FMN-dependent NADH-azoreductase n=1 Tax=Mameliella sediminis TaxID=2836866 RepID=UPI001C44C60C|nr:NAD(P)H-dependent oxidoreductase [Mameliella sediminis]MBY6113670.1 NAD(P)H-dependent oxidoreductase [Antarctobacter heliothermus]MBY6142982.1 NAD(P)H-dependent oxidoreductase [Mameliella alba]MBV7394967.1 NAD(P)H-dependent oxidoreductase [Mameliella sediminis]MBY6159837.1 NAD(P)H-dependent oxidoreductase [Mameliella alba]MBY6168308.1 NAD(P)H-dependent oxidoreductase [Mameliella alba]